jgi:hypothetical protein
MTDYLLTGHQCRPVAKLQMGPGRDWWLGELTEPLPDHPEETHCLHLKTPLKEVVLGVNAADLQQLAVAAHIVCGELNGDWLSTMAGILQHRTQTAQEEAH